jgi:hypothetical protein
VTSLSTNNKRRRQKAVEKGREVLDLECPKQFSFSRSSLAFSSPRRRQLRFWSCWSSFNDGDSKAKFNMERIRLAVPSVARNRPERPERPVSQLAVNA